MAAVRTLACLRDLRWEGCGNERRNANIHNDRCAELVKSWGRGAPKFGLADVDGWTAVAALASVEGEGVMVLETSGRLSRGVSLVISIPRAVTSGGSICIGVGMLGSNVMWRLGVGRESVRLLAGEFTPETVPSR